jgi:hypothetical protein
LNIVKRKQWVRLYLKCYLGLADDDRHCVLEDEPMLHHVVTLVEELIHLNVISLERLAILLHQGVAGELDDVVLVEVGSVNARSSFLHA